MKQNFDRFYFEKFKNKFKIKEKPSKIEEEYFKKTVKYLKFIKWIPGIKMIWVWNSLAFFWANKDSDIDLYIVTNKNAMWFVRILVTFIFQILKVRKTAKKHAGMFCLSFFSTIDWMDFSSFKVENDIYLFFRILYFKPILNYNKTYETFLEKNNSWADFSDYKDILEKNKKFIKYEKNTKNKVWLFVKLFDKIFKKIFLPKTKRHFERIWKPFWVIINDNLLKFHNSDIRKEVFKNL